MTRLIDRAARAAPLWGATVLLALSAGSISHSAEPKSVAGVICNNPPRINCGQSNCLPELSGYQGDALEPKSGRKFFLDFPCDLKPNEKVVFILNIHGAGSVGNWQRHYFPAIDYKEKYRLVIATPTAKASMPGRTWQADADDKFLQDVSDEVIAAFGRKNIKSFWLAGHSQGGITSRRIVCSPYFRGKVDGFISLSGGRVGNPDGYVRTGAAQGAPGGAPARGGAAPAAPAAAPARAAAAPPPPLDCDFSFIYSQGELEGSVPDVSTWAQKYGCGARRPEPDIV
ncbi:MAG: alpha/beta hydrolase, partial [Alphaproteobacteria bacterium]